MNMEIIDVLPPYEDEVLISWIVRMLKLYSCKNKLDNYSGEFMKVFFGKDTIEKPGLCLQKGLQYFADNCHLNNPGVFLSEYTMTDKLTVLPFYFSFCNKTYLNEFYSDLANAKFYRTIESKYGIRIGHKNLEETSVFKFCPECLKEQSDIYLIREHQVKGNYVCWKHGCVLHTVPYKHTWKYIDFVSSINEHFQESTYNMSNENFLMAQKIATTIHEIFENGFQEDVDTLKRKLLSKMIEQGILNKNGIFYNQVKFANGLGVDFLYENSVLFREIGLAIGNWYIPNPIIYIVLIISLFGGLEEYYSYNIF